MLGWDITDFGSGDFYNKGLLLFTLRNGSICDNLNKKPYAEKIMVVEEKQITPMHFHWNKTEDIINRGGGNLIICWRMSINDVMFIQKVTLKIFSNDIIILNIIHKGEI